MPLVTLVRYFYRYISLQLEYIFGYSRTFKNLPKAPAKLSLNIVSPLEIIERANRTSFYGSSTRRILFVVTAAEIKKIKAKNRAEVELDNILETTQGWEWN